VTFINDSKSTNMESTITAIHSQTGPMLLLVGGQPKGESFAELSQHLNGVHTLVAFGDAVEILQLWIVIEAALMWNRAKGVLPEPLPQLPTAAKNEGGRVC
jgi:UDP-N-acetylmuramoylalanine-D-glutamate ligase